MQKSIYIILMNTGTFPGFLVKEITRYKYSHVVLSLDSSFKKLYSFGRKQIKNFLDGGFVTYGVESDFFKKFKNTKCIIYKINIPHYKYSLLKQILKEYEKNMNIYKYDFKGVFIRYFYAKAGARENYYVCSNFVATVLEKANICKFNKPALLVRPRDFSKLDEVEVVYEGNLLDAKKNIRKQL